jgi:hypothetical protein
VVELFHEESVGGVESVIVSRKERSAQYSEMGAEKTWWWKWKRKKRRRKRRIF